MAKRTKLIGNGLKFDPEFRFLLALDLAFEDWRALATEWWSLQKQSGYKATAIFRFFAGYLHALQLDKRPLSLFEVGTCLPDLLEALEQSSKEIAAKIQHDIISDFLEWVLRTKLAEPDTEGHWILPERLRNPFSRIQAKQTGKESDITFAHVTMLDPRMVHWRTLAAEWLGAQKANVPGRRQALDKFLVGYLIGSDLPRNPIDFLTRATPKPKSTFSEVLVKSKTRGAVGQLSTTDVKQNNVIADFLDWVLSDKLSIEDDLGHCVIPGELHNPVARLRAVALYIKLELPLRTFQVRMLDSGEADTWRYVHGTKGGSFVLNDSPLATGSATRPYQRGVFHRSANESDAGLFINTNKTADISKDENAKGYVIPWSHDIVLYWLEKLRNWQERYNPISAPTTWAELDRKHFGYTPPHPEVLESRGTACFLFRDGAAAKDEDRRKPLINNSLDRLWYKLLTRLEQRCLDRGETLDDGTPIQFVDHDRARGIHYPLHALRVSLITYLVLDLQLPLAVVSKLIAGHARLVMTIYYTKFGHAYMKEVLDAAERNTLAADEASHRRFLMDATMEQVSQRFASVSVDALRAAVGQKSAATFVFEDKGICPVGGSMCDVGGESITDQTDNRYFSPVPGYPERNCVRCRFFLSGPAFLPGLQAHFNAISYEAHERAERHNDLQEEVTLMENRRADCERDGRLFTENRDLEKLSQRFEAEAEAMGKLVNDLQATYHLIARSMEIMKQTDKEGLQLVAVGEMNDIGVAFTETNSELHQLEVICENATIYPEIDARKPTLRRSQLLDCMLEFNKMPPVFFRLNPKQQLEVGNAVMQLIQARTGSLKGALEYVEGQRRLRDLGIVDETWDVIAEKVGGTPAREIIDTFRAKRALHSPKGENHAS